MLVMYCCKTSSLAVKGVQVSPHVPVIDDYCCAALHKLAVQSMATRAGLAHNEHATEYQKLTLMVGPLETVNKMTPTRMTDMSMSIVALRPIQSPITPNMSCPIKIPISCRYVVAWVQVCRNSNKMFETQPASNLDNGCDHFQDMCPEW